MKCIVDGRQILSETATTYGHSEYIGIHALASVVNSLMAAGAANIGVEIRITYPSHSGKSVCYSMEKQLKKECVRRGGELLESRIFENPLLGVYSVTVGGIAAVGGEKVQNSGGREKLQDNGGVQYAGSVQRRKSVAEADIVMSKWVGMDGMIQAAREKKDMLAEHFAPAFIRQILSYEKELFAGKELQIARNMKVSVIRQITQGGIFAALWELSKALKTGLEMDMKSFPILQETVEVCEHFRLNPYQLTSAGSFLFVTEDGESLREAFREEGIAASIIGKTVDGQGKIIRNGEDVRYIDRPSPDEIWKLHGLER